jgi:hypothetical protein
MGGAWDGGVSPCKVKTGRQTKLNRLREKQQTAINAHAMSNQLRFMSASTGKAVDSLNEVKVKRSRNVL